MREALSLFAGGCLFIMSAASAAASGVLEDPKVVAKLQRGFVVEWMAFNQDGSALILQTDSGLRVWPLKTKKAKRVPRAAQAGILDAKNRPVSILGLGENRPPDSLGFSVDGSRISGQWGLYRIGVWDAKTKKVIDNIQPSEAMPIGSGLSADGSEVTAVVQVLTGWCPAELWTWRVGSADRNPARKKALEESGKGGCGGARLSPDGSKVLLDWTEADPEVLDIKEGKYVRLEGMSGRYKSALFSPDGAKVLLAREEELWIFDVQSGKPLFSFDFARVHSWYSPTCAWSGDARRIAAAETGKNPTIRVWKEDEAGHWVPDAALGPLDMLGVAETILGKKGKSILADPARLVDPRRADDMTAEERFKLEP